MGFDHILLIGYGGPRAPQEVLPFLQSMAAEKKISQASLKAIARNYKMITGASPYHKDVMRFARRLEKSIQDSGIRLPVFVGMKNWHPFLHEVLPRIQRRGHKRGLAIVLSAFRGAVSGARYHEALMSAQSFLKSPVVEYDFIEGWSEEKLFIEAQAQEVSKKLQMIPAEERHATPILFTFHSLPMNLDQGSPRQAYPVEAREAGAAVAGELGHAKWSVVYQSCPVNARGKWLAPDISEAIEQLAGAGEKRALVVPLGFFCDHLEILYDLDHEARDTAQRAGLEYLRVATVINHPKILRVFKKLVTSCSHDFQHP